MIKPEEINAVLKKENISVAQFAKNVGVNPNTAYKYVHGKIQRPKPDILEKIVRYIRKAEKRDLPTLKRTIKPKLEPLRTNNIEVNLEAYHVQTPSVKAIIQYTVTAEAELDVREEIISTNPLTTRRVYGDPRNVKVLETGMSKGDYEMLKVISEITNTETFPPYTR